MKIGRRTALARTIIMLDITRQNVEDKAIRDTVEKFYKETGVQTPGIGPRDFTEAVMKARMLV